MKIGIESTAYFGYYNFEEGMKQLRSHGYDGFDYQGVCNIGQSPIYKMTEGEAERYLTEVKECAAANELEIHQLHGVWPHVDDTTQAGREKTIEYLQQNLLQAKFLGCPYVVIHPCMFKGWGQGTLEEMFDVNVALLRKLLPYAEKYGVTVCMENMPFAKGTTFSTAAELKAVVQELNSPFIKICLDTGHLNVSKGDMYEAICLFGDDLAALHVHDDMYGQDRHLIPFQGEVDWNGLVRGLKDISYKGFMSLETKIQLSTPQPMLDEMRISLAKIARHLADAVEK